MATRLNLPYTRYVCQVSTGEPRPKAGYVAMMEENLTSLQVCAWRKVATTTSTLTPHDFTRESYFDDSYDAFKMTGAWSTQTQSETAFAGMAAYAFKLPDDYATAAANLVSVELPISRDRFCLGGVRLAVAFSSDGVPSRDWSAVRGVGGVAAEEGLLAQPETPYVTKSAPAAETVSVDLAGTDSQTKPAYMIVYVTLESYTDHWEMYSAKEARNYAVEGSAILSGDEVVVEFSADVDEDADAVHSVKVINQYEPQFRKGLTGWMHALVWFNGLPVASTDELTPTSIAYRDWLSYPGITTPESLAQMCINNLYGMLERGMVHLQQSESAVRSAGASFSISVDVEFSGAAIMYHAFSLLASSYLLPMRMPYGFAVRRIKVTWNNWKADYDGGNPSEEVALANVPAFVGDAAQEQGHINAWLKEGAYVDAFTEALLKNPRIYDAAENSVDGWRLIGQIPYSKAADKIISFDLSSPITAPFASLLFTAFVPADKLSAIDVFVDTISVVDLHQVSNPIGICPVPIDSYATTDPASFVPEANAVNLTFRPGVILEG